MRSGAVDRESAHILFRRMQFCELLLSCHGVGVFGLFVPLLGTSLDFVCFSFVSTTTAASKVLNNEILNSEEVALCFSFQRRIVRASMLPYLC